MMAKVLAALREPVTIELWVPLAGALAAFLLGVVLL